MKNRYFKMRILAKSNIWSLVFVSLFFSCKPQVDAPVLSEGEADLGTLVAIGGDFLSGYEHGALTREGQQSSIPMLFAQQVNEIYLQGGALGSVSTFKQPLMPIGQGFGFNSKAWEGEFISPITLGYKVDCEGTESLSPLKNIINLSPQSAGMQQLVDGGYQNLAVPSAKMVDIFDPAFGLTFDQGNSNPFYGKIASDPGTSTIMQDALNLSPTFSLLWLGMEDVFSYASVGGYNVTIISAAQFAADLDVILAPLTSTGGKGAIANIPSLDDFPYYKLVPPRGMDLTLSKADSLNNLTGGLFDFKQGSNGFIIEDADAPSGYEQMGDGEYILLNVNLDSMRCDFLGVFNPIPDRFVIDSTESTLIHDMIRDFNQVIYDKSVEYGLAFVDMNSYFSDLSDGIKWNGVDYSTEFVSGGFISLDGYHPNQKGYGLITNEFIKAINTEYNATIPPTYCPGCVGIKFP